MPVPNTISHCVPHLFICIIIVWKVTGKLSGKSGSISIWNATLAPKWNINILIESEKGTPNVNTGRDIWFIYIRIIKLYKIKEYVYIGKLIQILREM